MPRGRLQPAGARVQGGEQGGMGRGEEGAGAIEGMEGGRPPAPIIPGWVRGERWRGGGGGEQGGGSGPAGATPCASDAAPDRLQCGRAAERATAQPPPPPPTPCPHHPFRRRDGVAPRALGRARRARGGDRGSERCARVLGGRADGARRPHPRRDRGVQGGHEPAQDERGRGRLPRRRRQARRS